MSATTTETEQRMARADDGVALAYRTTGSGPFDLLLVHGWAGSGAYFDELLGYLDPRGLRVTTVDLRGHGASEKPLQGYDLDTLASDVLTIADQLGAAAFVLLGFGLGAKLAQYVGTLAHHRLLGLVLVAGWPASQIAFPPAAHQDWIDRAGSLEKMIELARWFLSQPVDRSVLDRWAREAARVPRTVLDQTLRSGVGGSFAERLDTIQSPTLVIGGLHDTIFSPRVLRDAVVDALPSARLALLDCNHQVPLERPIELAGLLQAFLAPLLVSTTTHTVRR
jgi:non-heme chloroperoxidase